MYMTTVNVDTPVEERLWTTPNGTGEAVTVSEDMFGMIAVGRPNHDSFETDFDEMGGTRIRYPGGTFAEEGGYNPETGAFNTHAEAGDEPGYSLDHPDLMHPDLIAQGSPGFSEILQYGIDENVSVSVIVPVMPYVDDPESAYDATMQFLNDLYINGAYNDGNLPENLTLDIGNEVYDDPAHVYAPVALNMLQAVHDFEEANDGLDVRVSIQSMQSGTDTEEFVSVFTDPDLPPEQQDLLQEVDVVRHHILKADLNGDDAHGAWDVEDMRYYRIDPLVDAIVDQGGETPYIDISAWSATSGDVVDGEIGLPAASAMVSSFTGMLELGADAASIWGVNAGPNNETALSFGVDGERYYTAAGATFELMSESIIGMTLIDTTEIDNNHADPYQLHAFAGDGTVVIFASPNDFEGDGFDLTIDLTGFGTISTVEVVYVRTVDGTPDGMVIDPDETYMLIEPDDADTLTVHFTQPYELARITITELVVEDSVDVPVEDVIDNPFDDVVEDPVEDVIEEPVEDPIVPVVPDEDMTLNGTKAADVLIGGTGNDVINGRANDDVLDGNAGDDLIKGANGNDHMAGGAGDDTLLGGALDDAMFGGSDDDLLKGGAGDDFIEGGDGNDELQGNKGADELFGGAGDDMLNGGKDDDILSGGEGNDLLIGGAGNDTYVLDTTLEQSDDLIRGFNVNQDSIRVDGLQGSDAELSIEETEEGLMIRGGSASVLLENVSADQFDDGLIHYSDIAPEGAATMMADTDAEPWEGLADEDLVVGLSPRLDSPFEAGVDDLEADTLAGLEDIDEDSVDANYADVF